MSIIIIKHGISYDFIIKHTYLSYGFDNKLKLMYI
jgi:hypothetical protein